MEGALGLAYTRNVEEGGEDGSEDTREIVLGISPCRLGRRDA
jgi:hypothetical protein